jgi:hypothetical protein
MAQQELNHAEVGPPFEQMGGVGVPERMGRDVLGDTRRRRASWNTRDTLSRVSGPPWVALGKSTVVGPTAFQYSRRTARR